MIVLVCGGRDYSDREHLNVWLNQLDQERGPIRGLVHGAAPGADTLAAEWQRERIAKMGPRGELWMAGYPADWATHGKAAGPIRNQYMIDRHGKQIGLVIAFPGGRGTADMVRRAKAAGLEVIETNAGAHP